MITQEQLSDNGFACTVLVGDENTQLSYFGPSSKVYSCAKNPKKPTKKLIKYVETLGFSCYIKESYNGFWDKYFKHLICYK